MTGAHDTLEIASNLPVRWMMLAGMTDDFSVDEAALTTTLASVREAIKRGRTELEALDARHRLVAEHVDRLEEVERSIVGLTAVSGVADLHGGAAMTRESSPGTAESDDGPALPEAASQIDRVKALLAAHPDRTWRAQQVAAEVVGTPRTKAQLDTVRTTIHRLVQRGDVTTIERGVFRWGGA